MRYSKKYSDDMVENLAEIPWTCSDGPGSAPNEIPKGVSFLEREQEREGGRGPWSSWRRERFPASFTSHSLGPTRARHPQTVRRALADGPRGARTVRPPRRGRSIICSRTSSAAPLSYEPRGRSALPRRTVRQERSDSPAHCRGRSDLPFQF
jgi:hypothetical protein